MARDFRAVSLRILDDVFKTGRWADDSIEANVKSIDENHKDIKKVYELVYGILRNKNYIDYMLSMYVKNPPSSVTVKNILRIGYYQVKYMDSIPSYAAINTCTELAKTYAHKKTAGFVNAVLRKAAREKNFKPKIPTGDKVQYFSILYSCPEWMAEFFLKNYHEKAETILRAGNIKPPLFLKVNGLKTTGAKLKAGLEKQGVETDEVPGVKNAYIIKSGDVTKTAAFEEGLFYIQDLSSQFLGRFVSAKQKDALMDIGAAPGGKSAYFSVDMKNKGQILAIEPQESRITLMERNFVRLGITNVEIIKHDATADIEAFHNRADKIVIDAPCSGLGVIRRHPEKKWGIKEEELKEFPKLQFRIIDNVKKWVKKGGEVFYSTCTINPAENEKVIEKFLEKNKNFKVVDVAGAGPRACPVEFKHGKYFLALPGNKYNTDGFFIARMKRVK